MSEVTPIRVIRDPEFGKRLNSACDKHPHCPPLHSGRLSWIVNEFKTRFDAKLSMEAARRWLAGETKPHRKNNAQLAEILGVDEGWLYFGLGANTTASERRARDAMVDGIVNVVAGYIQLDGGTVAFPQDDEGTDGIDIHAIIKGARYAFHVTLMIDGVFSVPLLSSDTMVVLGAVRREGFGIDLYEITPEIIEAHGAAPGPSVPSTQRNATHIRMPDDADWPQITSFAQRL